MKKTKTINALIIALFFLAITINPVMAVVADDYENDEFEYCPDGTMVRTLTDCPDYDDEVIEAKKSNKTTRTGRNPQTGKEIQIAAGFGDAPPIIATGVTITTNKEDVFYTNADTHWKRFDNISEIHSVTRVLGEDSSLDVSCGVSQDNEIVCRVTPFDGYIEKSADENVYCWGNNELRECHDEEIETSKGGGAGKVSIQDITVQKRSDGPESSIEAYYQGLSQVSEIEVFAWSWGSSQTRSDTTDLDDDNLELRYVWSVSGEPSSSGEPTEDVSFNFAKIEIKYSADNGNTKGSILVDLPEMSVSQNTLIFTSIKFGANVFGADLELCGKTKHLLFGGDCDAFTDKAAAAGEGVGEILATHICPIHGYRLIIARPAGFSPGASERVIQVEKMNKFFHATWNEVSALRNNYMPNELDYFKLPRDLDFNAQRYCNRDGHMIPTDTDVYQVSLAHYNDYNGVTSIFADNNIETAPLHLVIMAYNQRRNQGDALPATCNYGCLSGSSGVMPDTKPADINFGELDFGDTDPRNPGINTGGVDVNPGVGGGFNADNQRARLALAKEINNGIDINTISREDRLRAREYLSDVQDLKGADLGLAIAVFASENDRVRQVRYNNQTNTVEIEHSEEVRLLGFIRMNARAYTTIDAEGREETRLPWWAALARTSDNRVRFKAGADMSKSVN